MTIEKNIFRLAFILLIFQNQEEKRQAEREREYYSEQVLQLLDILKSKPTSTPSSPMQIGRKSKPVSPVSEFVNLCILITWLKRNYANLMRICC